MDTITEFLRHENYYKKGSLINDPEPMGEEPICIFYRSNTTAPVYSIVMPIHNQEEIIEHNLESIIAFTKGSYEIIIILDACDDLTENIVLRWAFNRDNFDLTIIKSKTPLFETAADNIGFRLAKGTYILEIQADMEMTEAGYNVTLARPFEYENVIGVSGRCCHSLDSSHAIGRAGTFIDKSVDQLGLDRNTFYIHETSNRGPLLLRRKMVAELGYLDEQNFYLDYSEHDLLVRARIHNKWFSGYVPIDFLSPLSNGSTRKKRNTLNTEYLEKRKARCGDGFFWNYFKTAYTPMNPFGVHLE